MQKIKFVISIVFIGLGLFFSYWTFNFADKVDYKVFDNRGFRDKPLPKSGTGIDSSNDGVAVGLGVISGLSFLSSAIIIGSMTGKEKI